MRTRVTALSSRPRSAHFGQARGIVRAGPVLNLYYFLVSTASVFAAAEDVKLMSGEDVSDPAFIAAHAALLYDMLIVPVGEG
jgi:hypothetical protein